MTELSFVSCRYQMYATTQSWKVSMVNESAAEKGGYRECILQVHCRPVLPRS